MEKSPEKRNQRHQYFPKPPRPVTDTQNMDNNVLSPSSNSFKKFHYQKFTASSNANNKCKYLPSSTSIIAEELEKESPPHKETQSSSSSRLQHNPNSHGAANLSSHTYDTNSEEHSSGTKLEKDKESDGKEKQSTSDAIKESWNTTQIPRISLHRKTHSLTTPHASKEKEKDMDTVKIDNISFEEGIGSPPTKRLSLENKQTLNKINRMRGKKKYSITIIQEEKSPFSEVIDNSLSMYLGYGEKHHKLAHDAPHHPPTKINSKPQNALK
jgi:hypothetical protein